MRPPIHQSSNGKAKAKSKIRNSSNKAWIGHRRSVRLDQSRDGHLNLIHGYSVRPDPNGPDFIRFDKE